MGHAEPHRCQGHGAAGSGAQAIINSGESERAIVTRLPRRGEGREAGWGTYLRRAPVEQGPAQRASGGGHSIGHGHGSCLGWSGRRQPAL